MFSEYSSTSAHARFSFRTCTNQAVARSVERWTFNSDDLGSSSSKRTISTKSYPPSTQSVNIVGYQRLVHLIPCLCGMGCNRSIVLEMEVWVSVYFIIIIIIIIHFCIPINDLMGRKLIFNQPLTITYSTHKRGKHTWPISTKLVRCW